MTDDLLQPALLALAILGLSAVFVRLFRRWSIQRNLLDHPNERSSHSVPTPRGGGLAIVVLTLLAGILAVLSGHAPRSLPFWAAGGLAIAVVSWIDDLRGLSNRIRFAVHVAAAVAGVAAFGPWVTIGAGAVSLPLGVAAWPLTLIWIVGLTNAWNFMDGIDGIAGLSAILAAAAFIALSSNAAALILALALAASTAGFLTLNWPPARIFMGDVGSAFLGYTLAVLPLSFADAGTDAIWLAVLPVWPFVLDTAFTLLRRLRRKENIFAAHRSHLYQRLVIAGWPHVAVTLAYGLLTAIGGLAAVAIRQGVPVWAALALVGGCAGSLLLTTNVSERRALRRH